MESHSHICLNPPLWVRSSLSAVSSSGICVSKGKLSIRQGLMLHLDGALSGYGLKGLSTGFLQRPQSFYLAFDHVVTVPYTGSDTMLAPL